MQDVALTKRCPDCEEVKSLDDFPRHKRNKDGHHTYCKSCHNTRCQETRQRLYGGSRHYHLVRRYGIGEADVQAMIEAQNGICLICGDELVRPHVDHDHKTGNVRGILCFNCNGGLGKFKDDMSLLLSAVLYLDRSEQL